MANVVDFSKVLNGIDDELEMNTSSYQIKFEDGRLEFTLFGFKKGATVYNRKIGGMNNQVRNKLADRLAPYGVSVDGYALVGVKAEMLPSIETVLEKSRQRFIELGAFEKKESKVEDL